MEKYSFWLGLIISLIVCLSIEMFMAIKNREKKSYVIVSYIAHSGDRMVYGCISCTIVGCTTFHRVKLEVQRFLDTGEIKYHTDDIAIIGINEISKKLYKQLTCNTVKIARCTIVP